jgi:hypothetical protein
MNPMAAEIATTATKAIIRISLSVVMLTEIEREELFLVDLATGSE